MSVARVRGGSLQVRVREGGQDRWRHSTGAATREEERDLLLDYNKEYKVQYALILTLIKFQRIYIFLGTPS